MYRSRYGGQAFGSNVIGAGGVSDRSEAGGVELQDFMESGAVGWQSLLERGGFR